MRCDQILLDRTPLASTTIRVTSTCSPPAWRRTGCPGRSWAAPSPPSSANSSGSSRRETGDDGISIWLLFSLSHSSFYCRKYPTGLGKLSLKCNLITVCSTNYGSYRSCSSKVTSLQPWYPNINLQTVQKDHNQVMFRLILDLYLLILRTGSSSRTRARRATHLETPTPSPQTRHDFRHVSWWKPVLDYRDQDIFILYR